MRRDRNPRQDRESNGNITATVALSAGILFANLIGKDNLVIRADDPISRKIVWGMPSAAAAPEITGSKVGDIGLLVATTGVTLELARRTSTAKELSVMAIAAQGMANAANIFVDRMGWLNSEERKRKDVGTSAIYIAWATKYLSDRFVDANSKKARIAWGLSLAAVAGGSTIGAYLAKDSVGGKLDATAHGSGAIIGGLAHWYGKR